MNLQEVQTLNNLRLVDINSLLEELHAKLENIFAELESQTSTLKSLKDETQLLTQEKEESLQAINILKIDNQKIIDNHLQEVTELENTEVKLSKLNKDAKKEYAEMVNAKNTLLNDITVEKNELKVRELALKAKVEAFKKDREDFNFEKRQFEAEKSDYSGII